MTQLICLEINTFHEVYVFFREHKADSFCGFCGFLTCFEGGILQYLTDGKFPCHISFFAYTFCRLLHFSQKLNMILLDFHNTHPDRKCTKELFKYGSFLKLSMDFCFHKISAKCRLFTAMWFRAETLFFKTDRKSTLFQVYTFEDEDLGFLSIAYNKHK